METSESPTISAALDAAGTPVGSVPSADAALTHKATELARQHSARRPGPPSTAVAAAPAPAHLPQELSNHDGSPSETQLADVWRHLKQLEKAVKSHIQSADGSPQHASTQSSGGIGRGGSSILSAAAGHHAAASDASSSDDSAGEESPARSARMSERQKLRDSLSKIKSEIAEKAVKEVEAQLLQQRVACLEAALAGLTGGGLLAATGPGCASCAGSYAGSMLSLSPGRASVCLRCQSQQQQPFAQQQAPRASSPMRLEPGVSQLYDRLGDMEAAMRELAHAQATSSNVLSNLGGRLSTGAGNNWPSQAGAGNATAVKGSLLRRPPSSPPGEGPLGGSFGSPPAQRPSGNMGHSSLPDRPSSACAMHGGSPGGFGFSSVLANPVFSFDSPSRSSASPATPPASTSGAAGSLPQQSQPATQHATLLQRVALQQSQQAQEQHHWHVDVVLACHDAELAGVKESVGRLEAAQEATATLAEETAMHVASLDDRIRALEHGQPYFAAGGLSGPAAAAAVDGAQQDEPDLEATLSRGMGQAPAAPDAEAAAGSASVPAADAASDVPQAPCRISTFEAASVKQQEAIDSMRLHAMQMQAELHQTVHTMHLMSNDDQSADKTAAAAAGPRGPAQASAQTPAEDQAALIQQILSSKLLDDIINSRVQQAVVAQMAATQAGAAPASAAASGAQHAAGTITTSSSRAPSCQGHDVEAALEGSADLHDAAAQTAFVYGTLQQLHGRLLAVEGAVQRLMQQQPSVASDSPQTSPPAPVAERAAAEAAPAAAVAEGAGPVSAAAKSADQCNQSPLDVEVLEDGFSSFQSATRWLSSSGPETSAPAADTPEPQQPQDPEASTSSTTAAQAAEPTSDATPAPVPADAALETSLAGGTAAASAVASLSRIAAQLAPPAPLQAEGSSAYATPATMKSGVWSSRGTSTTQVQTQLTALQHEVDSCQLQTMQAALQTLDSKLQLLQQQQAEQGVLIDSQKVSTGASLALLMPLEPRVDQISGQLGSLASQVAALHALMSQQPARFEVLQSEIEQLSQQLAEVNEAAAEEPEVQALREKLEGLLQQHAQLRADLAADIQAATNAAAAAAAVATTAAEAAAGVEASTQQQLAAQQEKHDQWQQQAAEAILQRLAAVEGSVQQLTAMQEEMSQLQQQVEMHMDSAREQAAMAAAASAEQKDVLDALAVSASAAAAKLAALEVSVEEKVGEVAAAVSSTAQQAAADTAALEAKLQQQEQALQTALTKIQAEPSAELAGKVQALEQAWNSKVAQVDAAVSAATQLAAESAAAVDAKLDQRDEALHAAFTAAQEAHDADLKRQLKEQVDTMAQILADVGTYKAEQAAVTAGLQEQLSSVKDSHSCTLSNHTAQLEQLTGQLQLTAQQLKDELSSTITPLRTQLQTAIATLAEHSTALEGTHSVAAAVEMLSGLPAAAADLSARLDELAQAQRAAEGELSANKEHCLVLDQQVAAAQAQLQVLEATLAAQQDQHGVALQQLRQEMLEPVMQELERLQTHKQRLHNLQLEQASAVERLGGAVQAVKGDVLAELARERQRLAQAVDELQTVVSEQCIKTDQLGTIFAARDNMYGAWLKMQAVFDANRSPRRGATAAGGRVSVQDCSPSSSLFRPRNSLAFEGGPGGIGMTSASGAAQSASGAADPFNELLNRLAIAPQPQQQQQQQQPDMAPAQGALASAEPLQAQAAPSAEATATASAVAESAPAAGSSTDDLADVAEAQCQLRDEVGSLAIQLHGAIADLSEQVAALRQVQAEHQQQHYANSAAARASAPIAGSSTHGTGAAAEAPAVQADSSAPHTPPACSGVLHAPLSLVVQLQQELSAMKAESISKEQFAAVVRMVKELRSQSCSSEVSSPMARSSSTNAAASRFAAAVLSAQPSSASVLDTAAAADSGAAETSAAASRGPSSSDSSTDKVSQMLQQHSEQLAAVESSLEALVHKAESAETIAASQQPQVQELQQQQADLQQQQLELSSALVQQQAELQAHNSQVAAQTQELTSNVSKLQADVQQQDAALAQLATVLASVSVTQNEVKGLSHQQSSLQAELSKVSAYVDELASKLHSAANAAALAVARPHSSSTLEAPAAGSGGFSEMVAGLANLKSCLDQQATAVADLSTRLQDQEAVLQGLIEGAAAAGSSKQGSSAEGVSTAEGGPISKAEVQELAAQLASVHQKLAALEQLQGINGSLSAHDAVPAAPTAPASRSRDSAADAVGAAAETDAVAEPDADGQPLGFMHGMLVDLKKRIDKLEADSIEAKATAVTVAALTAASSAASSPAQQPSPAHGSPAAIAAAASATPAASSMPATPTHKGSALTAKKGMAWAGHGGHNAAASMEELQEWLACLQGQVARLDAADASLMATLESLRGDVGAAAAAAAAAAIAAKLTAAGSPTTSASAAPASVSEISAAQAQSATQTATDSSSGLWAAVEELRAQLVQLQEAESTAQAAAWAAGECGISADRSSSSSSSRKVASTESAIDVDQLKLQLLAEVSALQAAAAAQQEAAAPTAAAADTAAAVAFLNTRVIELQDTLTEVAAQAAAAAALAAAAIAGVQSAAVVNNSGACEERLLDLQAQLDSIREPLAIMQQQMQQLPASLATSAEASHLPPTAPVSAAAHTPVYTATPGSDSSYVTPGDESFFTPTGDEAAQQSPAAGEPREGTGLIQKCLSFGDLARSSGGNTPAAAADAAATPAAAFEPEFGTPVEPSAANAGEQQGIAAASPGSAVPSRKFSDADSRDLSRASSTSSRSSSKSGKLSVRQLLDDMSALPAAKQVAIVSKLAGLVSSHATRLLATYHEDPDLSAQLQTVQQQLSAAVQSAAAGSSGRRSDGKDSSSPPSRHVARSISTGTGAAAAAAGVSSSSSDALLCILDQLASLRAIGSATHPAIAEKLHKHEVQLAELKEAQQGIVAAINALSGGAEVTQVLSVPAAPTAECASPSDSKLSASPAASSAMSPAASGNSSPAAAADEGEGAAAVQQPGPNYEGELAHRLADVEGRLAAGLKVLSAVRSKLSPLQEVADATQSMMRELQVAHGLTLQRLESLEGLAAQGAAASTADPETGAGQPGGVLVVASSLKKLQEHIQAASRRLSVLEGSMAVQMPECLTLCRRLAARQADAESRSSTVTSKVSILVSTLPPLIDRVGELESRLTRSLTIAKQGLDILADQLVALGALSGRSSPNKNPLAALGPHHAAITALEGKVEAVRTAMTASVKLMIQELGSAVEAAGNAGSVKAAVGSDAGAAVAGLKVIAEEASKAAAASHEEAMQQLERKLAGLQAELRAATAAADARKD